MYNPLNKVMKNTNIHMPVTLHYNKEAAYSLRSQDIAFFFHSCKTVFYDFKTKEASFLQVNAHLKTDAVESTQLYGSNEV